MKLKQGGRILLTFTIVLAILFAGFLLWPKSVNHDEDSNSPAAQEVFESQSLDPTVSEPVEPEEPDSPTLRTLSFSAVGDNLIHGSIYLQGRSRASGTEKEYDFTYLYEGFEEFLSRYDVNFINQETLLTDEIAPATYPCFASPGEIGRAAYAAGWRVFGTSNNHIYDQGANGIASTLRFWQTMPEDVLSVGLYTDEEDQKNIRTQTVNGITVAYLAYTQYTNGIPTPQNAEASIIYTSQTDVIEQQIRSAKEQADAVIVSVHWGVEDSHTVSQEQRELAQKMGNWGADVILGTHPHVLQTTELLKNQDGSSTLCVYSLGNFVSAQSRPDEMIGCALTFDLTETSENHFEIQNIQLHPTITDYGYNYSNIRVLPLYDYTSENALQHGVRTEYPSFNYDYILSVVQENVPEEYLNLEN